MLHECARNHRQQHKVFLPSLPSSCTRTRVFFCRWATNVHRPATTTHRHETTFFLLSLFRTLCFLSFPSRSCVKVAMCVFFVVFAPCWTTDFFHYNRLRYKRRCFLLFEKTEALKKSFVRIVEKGISVLMVFCFHVDVSCTFIPRNLGSLTWRIKGRKKKKHT